MRWGHRLGDVAIAATRVRPRTSAGIRTVTRGKGALIAPRKPLSGSSSQSQLQLHSNHSCSQSSFSGPQTASRPRSISTQLPHAKKRGRKGMVWRRQTLGSGGGEALLSRLASLGGELDRAGAHGAPVPSVSKRHSRILRGLRQIEDPSDPLNQRGEGATLSPRAAGKAMAYLLSLESQKGQQKLEQTSPVVASGPLASAVMPFATEVASHVMGGAPGHSTLRAMDKSASKPKVAPALEFSSAAPEYRPGTAISFGSTISLQAHHGGYLNFGGRDAVQASALGPLPNTLMTAWSLLSMDNAAPMCYGDALLLQIGRHEVLASSFVLRSGVPSDVGMPVPLNFRRENMDKARHLAWWLILNPEDPEGTKGQEVCHLDNVIFEQQWMCLASDTPQKASLKACGSVDHNPSDPSDSTFKDTRGITPPCIWKLRLHQLPLDTKVEVENRLLEKVASDQMDISKHVRETSGASIIKDLRYDNAAMMRRKQHEYNLFIDQRTATLCDSLESKFKSKGGCNWQSNEAGRASLRASRTDKDHGRAVSDGLWANGGTLARNQEPDQVLEGGGAVQLSALETAQANAEAGRLEALVKNDVWAALVKRFDYDAVTTDMLAVIRAVAVIKRSLRRMKQKKWAKAFAKIDPEVRDKVTRLRKIQEERKELLREQEAAAANLGSSLGSLDTADREAVQPDKSRTYEALF
ncbi:unnamed protein product, partial [Chrysoparadoxa australica]